MMFDIFPRPPHYRDMVPFYQISSHFSREVISRRGGNAALTGGLDELKKGQID